METKVLMSNGNQSPNVYWKKQTLQTVIMKKADTTNFPNEKADTTNFSNAKKQTLPSFLMKY